MDGTFSVAKPIQAYASSATKIQELLYTSAFWKSIRDLQGALVDKGRFPENLQKHHQWKTAEQLTHTQTCTQFVLRHMYTSFFCIPA